MGRNSGWSEEMRKFATALLAVVAAAAFAVPSAVAQEEQAKEHAEEHAKEYTKEYAGEHAEKHGDMKAHTMKGTMTPPESETMDIMYEMSWGEDGPMGWIVAANPEGGEDTRIEMKAIKMEGDYLTYSFTPPDEETDFVVSCKLMKQDDGGFAGDCKNNKEEDRTGHMTVAPMKEMANPCAGEMEMKKKEKEPSSY
jgi:hypothetical protein